MVAVFRVDQFIEDVPPALGSPQENRDGGPSYSDPSCSLNRFEAGAFCDGLNRLEDAMSPGTIILIILIVLLIAALPTWPYSAGWGAFPAGGLESWLLSY